MGKGPLDRSADSGRDFCSRIWNPEIPSRFPLHYPRGIQSSATKKWTKTRRIRNRERITNRSFFCQTVQTCANQDGWVAGPWGVVWVTGGVSGWRLRGNGPSGDDRHALVARTRQNLGHGVVGLRVERLGEPKRTHQTTRTSRANGVFWPCGSRDIRGHFSVSAVVRPNASERGQSPRASGIARTRGRHLLDVTQISSRIAGHAPSHRSLSHLSRTVVFRSHPPDRHPPISIFWLGAWWSGGDAGNTRGGSPQLVSGERLV